jgi:hypothetical protein
MGYLLLLSMIGAGYVFFGVLPRILLLIILACGQAAERARRRFQRWFFFGIFEESDTSNLTENRAAPTPFSDLKTSTQGETLFVYHPLPSSGHTRLLTLLPDDGTSTIECLLSQSDLSTQPHYKALSYVWGSVDTEYGILLNGKPFPVGANLWVALYHLRDPITYQTLWIDAISINQKDEAEKAVQIRQMGKIYSQAANVLAWLGPHSDKNIDEAIDDMGILYLSIPLSVRLGPPIKFPLTLDESEDLMERTSGWVEIATKLLRKHPRSPHSMALIFFYCPYWRRLWIIQEVLLAQKLVICCGNKRFPWEIYSELRPLMQHLHIMANTQPPLLPPEFRVGIDWQKIEMAFVTNTAANFDKLPKKHINKVGVQQDYDLKGLLNIGLQAYSSLPRDRLYGLLGVLKAPNMPADYEKPMFDIFTDALQHIKHPSVRGEGYMYDFHTMRFAQVMQALLKGPFKNSQDTTPCFRVCGFHTGTIMHVDTECTPDDSFNVIEAKLKYLFRMYPDATRGIPFTSDETDVFGKFAKIEAQIYAKEHNLPPAYQISPIITKTRSIYESKCMKGIHSWTAAYFKAVVQPYGPKVTIQESASLELPSVLINIDTKVSGILSPKLFLTADLGFGLCPASSLPGDIVVQFLNSDTAAILRPSVNSQQTQYCFKGRAFVGRDGGVDATMKMLNSPDIDRVKLHGAIVTTEEIAKKGLTSCIEMVVDAETLQHLTGVI